MFEAVDKLFLAGIGAMSMTKEKAEQIFEDYVQKGKVEREQKSGFVKDVMDMAERSREDLEKIIHEQVQKALEQMPLATKDDLKRVEDKLDQLLAEKG